MSEILQSSKDEVPRKELLSENDTVEMRVHWLTVNSTDPLAVSNLVSALRSIEDVGVCYVETNEEKSDIKLLAPIELDDELNSLVDYALSQA